MGGNGEERRVHVHLRERETPRGILHVGHGYHRLQRDEHTAWTGRAERTHHRTPGGRDASDVPFLHPGHASPDSPHAALHPRKDSIHQGPAAGAPHRLWTGQYHHVRRLGRSLGPDLLFGGPFPGDLRARQEPAAELPGDGPQRIQISAGRPLLFRHPVL